MSSVMEQSFGSSTAKPRRITSNFEETRAELNGRDTMSKAESVEVTLSAA
tara:strand:+ start:1575 stop:1724 length:150 start_codon:yes stop_codon:yes gene_type:complete